MADTVGGGSSGTTGAAGATTTGLGCNTAGSSSFTTGACVHADNKITVESSSAAIRDACIERRSGRRNEVVITLMFPFKLEKVVITTGRAIWIIPTHSRAPFINGAAAFGLVKKHTHGFVHRVFAVTKHAHRFALVLDLLGKFFTGNLDGNAVMPGQTRHVSGFGFDVIVATAVAGAFGAVVSVFGCHDANFKLFDTDSNGLSRSRHNELLKYLVRPHGVL